MNEETISKVETKAIDRVPNWFWGVAGIAFVSSVWLFFNGLNLGSIVNRYIDMRFEERRERIESVTSKKCAPVIVDANIENRLIKLEKVAHEKGK